MSEVERPRLLAAIVDRKKITDVIDIARGTAAGVHVIMNAHGTAGSDLMALLGLEEREKACFCCVVGRATAHLMLDRLAARLQLHKPGRGIAFTMVLSGINAHVMEILTQSSHEKGGETMAETSAAELSLILAIVADGRSEAVMTAAKSAGARGGTVLSARHESLDEQTLFGVAAHGENEVVAILTKREQKAPIMRAIADKCGMHTDARGVILSLPVEAIEGLGGMKGE